MASNRIKGITIEIGGDTTKLTKALSSVDNSIRNTKTNLNDLDRALKLDPSNTELLKDKQIELARQIDDTKKKLETEKQALDQLKQSDGFDENSRDAQNLKVQIDLDTAALKDLEQQAKDSSSVLGTQMKVAGDKIKAVGDKIKGVGDQISSLGSTMTTKVTAPIVGALGGSVKAAIDWETAFTGVQKTVDATAEEFDQLEQNIKDMATRTASSKEEIAGVMEVAGQLGVEGVDGLTTFTETMVNLGDTTNLSAEDAATALARFMNITGESYDNSDKLGSSIVDLGNNFATSESEIVEMATRLASAGTIAGLSSTDILALAASMSSVGIQAEAGGTAMTQTMTAIDKAVNGLDNGIEEVQKAEEKVAKASSAVADAQDNLKKKQIAYNEAVRKYGQSDAKSQESAAKKVETATSQLAGAQATAEKKQLAYNTAVEKYGADSSQAQTALINLQSAQDKVAEKTQKLTDAQNGLDSAMKGGSTSNAAVQKALIDLEQAERKVTEKTDALTSAQNALAEMSDGSSSKLELMAQVAGMSADQFSETWKTAPIDAINAFIMGLSNMDEESESTIKILDDLDMSGIRQSNMLKSLALASDQLTGAVQTSGAAYEENTALQDEAAKRYDTQAAKLSQLRERFMNVAVEIGEMLMPTLEKLTGFIEELIDHWNSLDESEKEQILQTVKLIAAIGPVLLIVGKVITAVGSLVSAFGAISAAAPAIGAALAAIGAALTGPIGIIAAIIAALAALGVAIYKNWDKIKAFCADVAAGFGRLKADVSAKWNEIKTNIANKVTEIKTNAINKFIEIKTKITDTFSNLKNGITTTIGNIKDAIVEKIGGAVQFIKDLPGQALQWGRDLIGGFVDGIRNKLDAAGDAAGWVAEKVAGFLHFSEPDEGPLANFHTFAPDMVKLFAQGITQSLPTLERAADQMAGVIANDATATLQGGQAASKTVNAPISINVYGAAGQDVNQLADIIQQKMNRAVINQKAVFA